MPTHTRTLQITDGPNFRDFAIANGIVTELQFDQVFTMDQKIPRGYTTIQKSKKMFQMKLKMFGRSPAEDTDDFVFIGHMVEIRKGWLYVGTYNTRTRKGQCEEMPSKEFFKSPIMRRLFPNLV